MTQHQTVFEQYRSCDAGMGFSFKALEQKTGLPRSIIRDCVHKLRDAGYLEFLRGAFTDEGELCGSVYIITQAGYRKLHADEAQP